MNCPHSFRPLTEYDDECEACERQARIERLRLMAVATHTGQLDDDGWPVIEEEES